MTETIQLPTQEQMVTALQGLRPWFHKCHQASLCLIRSGVLEGRARVARGFAEGVSSQHSWIVLGDDCYDRDATIIDSTLWSYRKDVSGIWVGTMRDEIHHPHGEGSIWDWGKPRNGGGKVIKLTPKQPLSKDAKRFIKLLGPLDRSGWHTLAAVAPVEGWPAGEIYAAMEDTKALSTLVPIDRIGMLTERNPGNLYW